MTLNSWSSKRGAGQISLNPQEVNKTVPDASVEGSWNSEIPRKIPPGVSTNAEPNNDQVHSANDQGDNKDNSAELPASQPDASSVATDWGKYISQQPQNVQDFFNKYKDSATLAASKLGVPPQAVLAQWALESGWGSSQLASQYNNLGGIKAQGNYSGDSVSMPSYEKNRSELDVSNFRSYKSPTDYANDYTKIIENPRYKSALSAKTPYDYALQLGLGGYHQDDPKTYANEVAQIAKRFA